MKRQKACVIPYFGGNWSEQQADAIRTLLVEVEKVKLLEQENSELRKRLNN